MSYSRPKDTKPAPANRRKSLIFASIVVGVVCLLAVVFDQAHRAEAELTRHWPKTTGRILHSKYQTWHWPGKDWGGDEYIPDVAYEYSVDDTSYRSQGLRGRGGRVYISEISFEYRSEVEDFLRQFPAGKVVDVYYSPDDPSKSVLIPGSWSRPEAYYFKQLLIGLFVVIAGMGVFFLIMHGLDLVRRVTKRRSETTKTLLPAEATRMKRRAHRGRRADFGRSQESLHRVVHLRLRNDLLDHACLNRKEQREQRKE